MQRLHQRFSKAALERGDDLKQHKSIDFVQVVSVLNFFCLGNRATNISGESLVHFYIDDIIIIDLPDLYHSLCEDRRKSSDIEKNKVKNYNTLRALNSKVFMCSIS